MAAALQHLQQRAEPVLAAGLALDAAGHCGRELTHRRTHLVGAAAYLPRNLIDRAGAAGRSREEFVEKTHGASSICRRVRRLAPLSLGMGKTSRS